MKNYDNIIRKAEEFTAEELRAVNPMRMETTTRFICKLTEDKAPLNIYILEAHLSAGATAQQPGTSVCTGTLSQRFQQK